MTEQRVRPALGYVLLAAFWANTSVWCFWRGDMVGTWAAFGCLFLNYELWAALLKVLGGTLSECIWAWLGINPRRPWTIARRVAAGLFLGEFLLHVVSGGQSWWSGGWAIGGTAVPVAIVVAFSLLFEREKGGTVMSLWSDIGKLRLILAIRSRLQEAGKMGKLKAVGFALGGAVATAVIAQVTGACPGLIGAAPAIVTAAIGGVVTYWMRKPLSSAVGKATFAGCIAFAVATVGEQIKQVCGGDFVQQLPALAMAGVWVGVGLWLKAPHETPPSLGTVTPPALKG